MCIVYIILHNIKLSNFQKVPICDVIMDFHQNKRFQKMCEGASFLFKMTFANYSKTKKRKEINIVTAFAYRIF